MQYLNGDLARLQVEQDDIKRKQQLGQTLQQAGLNPVQGGNSVLALLAALTSTLRGNSLMKDASKSMSENLASQFDAQNQADQAKAEAEQKRREEDWQRRLQEIDYGNKSAAQYRAPSNIDPNSPEGINARLQFEKGKAGLQPKAAGPSAPEFQRKIEALVAAGMPVADATKAVVLGAGGGGGSVPSGYRATQDGRLEAIPGGPADPAIKGAAGGGLGAEGAAKVSLYENAMRDALAYQKAVVNPDGSFNDVAANMPENVRLRESALRAKLRAESGASISPEEARAENDRYGPKLFSSDQTNAAAAKRLIEDLQHQSATIRGGGQAGAPPQGAPPSGAQQEFPDGTVIQNAQGQKMVMQAGQWVPQ